MPDYELHLSRGKFDELWSDDGDIFPFTEDLSEIEAAIEEELGSSKKRKKRKK